MDSYDTDMARRVWQRVHSSEVQAPEAEILPAMITGELASAAAYNQLARQYRGKDRALLLQLARQERAHAASLQGICTLLTGSRAHVKAAPPEKCSAATALRRCYGNQMRALARYEQWCAHPEYGPAFSRLVQQEWEICRILLQLLGK